MESIQNFIGGEFVPAACGRTIDNIDPATGEKYSSIPDSEKIDIDNAVSAAKRAYAGWSDLGPERRAEYLTRVADEIDQNLEALARAESIDTGKPLSLARTVDIPRAAENFRFFAKHIMRFSDERYTEESKKIHSTVQRTALGVAGCISPWNLPLYLLTWKIAPALAAGNCVVAKPSEVTPATASLLAELSKNAGLPDGVLNIVHGHGSKAGAALCEHPDVPVLSFTGGTTTGAAIKNTAHRLGKKVTLELGGKNPNIIFADADYPAMLATSLRSSFANQGEICLCGSRIFVEEGLYQKFREDFVGKTEELIVGDPLEPSTNQGALVSAAHMQKVLSYIELARNEGGNVLCGGERAKVPGRCANGYFVKPTVIEGLSPYCRTNQEEIFGPVVTLIPFTTEEEVIEWANATRYGLAASIWTTDETRAERVARAVDSGIIWINCWMARDLATPFGGFKDSGAGREGGDEILRFFTRAPKTISRLVE